MNSRNTRTSVQSTSKLSGDVKTSLPPTVVSSTVSTTTTIVDLNDDCLFEVYKKLGLQDLCSVADTCSRLKSTTRAHFANSELKTLNFPYSDLRYSTEPFVVNQLIYEASRVLRNFGASIISFSEFDIPYILYCTNKGLLPEYQRNIIELLVRHCGENLIELKLCHFDMTQEMASVMRTVLVRLQKFELHWGEFRPQLKMLSTWCPELQELQMDGRLPHEGWNQQFPKLKKIKFCCDTDRSKEFVKSNPQLKEIELSGFNLDPTIFRVIGDYAIDIETLIFRVGVVNSVGYPAGAKCFDRLRNLKSVTLFDYHEQEYLTEAILDIAAAQIQLKTLCVKSRSEIPELHQFVEGISKLKTLETLQLKVAGLRLRDVIHICKQLSELSKLRIRIFEEPTAKNISKLVRMTEKLQCLSISMRECDEKICFDADIYKALAQVVEERDKKVRLEITLNADNFYVDVPKELANTHCNSLSIVLK